MGRPLSPQVKEFALDFLRAIGTPLSADIISDIEQGMWDSIASRKVDPRDYTSAQEYFLDASAASLLRKYRDLPTSINLRGVALENWKKGEVDCARTNSRLLPYIEGWSHPDSDEGVLQFIAEVRKKIADVLGFCPSYDELEPRHGPGATFSDKSVRSTMADKMETSASLTTSAKWFLLDWVGTAWGRSASSRGKCPFFVRGNRFATAPKDATKDRPIAAEPSVNIFYQLALGQSIRRRLKKVGIDLENGQDTHRLKACEASISGSLATLDLSNASDTVAYNLVKLLLPPRWFTLLRELRSSFTWMSDRDASTVLGREPSQVGGHWVKLEKFSSMGNGFTFELETLIFWALSTCAQERMLGDSGEKVLCYGDDILCDSRAAGAVTSVLRFFGFSLNRSKSFVDGSFRESCGGDFMGGRPVRPYFQKEPLDEPQQLIAAANGIFRLAHDLFGGLGRLNSVWLSLQNSLPNRVRRCRGPQRLGDIVIHDEEQFWGWTSRDHDRVFTYVPVRYRKIPLRIFSDETVFACGLYGLRVSEGFINSRDSVTGYAVRKTMIYGTRWLPSPRLFVRSSTLHAPAGEPVQGEACLPLQVELERVC